MKKDVILAPLTTFNIGGPADWFEEVKNEKDLVEVITFCQDKKIPFLILGGGSNILFTDKGFRGMVIKVQSSKFKVKSYNSKFKITAEAGAPLNKLVNLATKNSLSGLEFAAGIPGTVGGAVVGNAGAWQESIGDRVKRVKILDKKNRFKWLNQADCQFAYRQSRFKKTKEIVLAVELVLKKGDQKGIKQKIEENLKKRELLPKELSAGSIFINPKPQSAGDLIEKCGLKGKKIGGAQISEKHANFIVNLDGAKAADVLELISLAKKKVKEKFGINLKPEIIILDEYGDQVHY